jgi:hypothetical protein
VIRSFAALFVTLLYGRDREQCYRVQWKTREPRAKVLDLDQTPTWKQLKAIRKVSA